MNLSAVVRLRRAGLRVLGHTDRQPGACLRCKPDIIGDDMQAGIDGFITVPSTDRSAGTHEGEHIVVGDDEPAVDRVVALFACHADGINVSLGTVPLAQLWSVDGPSLGAASQPVTS